MASDASRLLYDDALFCHLVEEVLQFEKELRGNQSYPTVLPGLLHILLEDAVLQKWLTVEKKSKLSSVRVTLEVGIHYGVFIFQILVIPLLVSQFILLKIKW